MGRYEGSLHGPSDFELVEPLIHLRNWVHDDRAQAVLKLWDDSAKPVTASFIITQARRPLIQASFLRGLPLPGWMVDGARFGKGGLGLQYDRVEVRLANIRHATTCLELEDTPESAKTDELNKQVQELDQALQDWVAQIPWKYSFKVHTVQEGAPWPRTHFYSPTAYSFSKTRYAAAWLRYFSTRMLIISTRLRILTSSHPRYLDDTYEKQKQDCNDILRITANSLASTVPFVLGRFKIEDLTSPPILVNEKEEIKPGLAMIAIWPLLVASGLKEVDRKQQLWFRSELARLGRVLGDGIIESAESENWITF